MEILSFEYYLKNLNQNTEGFRKATFLYEQEILKFLNIDLGALDDMTIKGIKKSLIDKRDARVDKLFLKRGFYTENQKGEVVFIEVKSGDVDDKAESMFYSKDTEIQIDCYVNFNDGEISSERLEALKELSISTYIGIEDREHSKEDLEAFQVSQREMELYKIVKDEKLNQ